ncbi:MAG: XdhC family protein [Pseudomonadota bacterium]
MLQSAALFDATDPAVAALIDGPQEAVLAVVAGVEGPSYRPVGAMMAVLGPNECVGTLSSGCIEADIALHAQKVLADGQPRTIRYGRGSPFMDIQLPCGGGLDILLLPRPDRAVLAKIAKRRADRMKSVLSIELKSGAMALDGDGQTQTTEHTLRVAIEPEVQFFVFGKGPEAHTFSALAHSVGYPTVLFSPDPETRAIANEIGCTVNELPHMAYPNSAVADDRTAVILFFHDHEWEPPILAGALETDAFYIGAQGSRAARGVRMNALRDLGVEPDKLNAVLGPIGLVPSARDPRTLAVSVLAEVLDKAAERTE